VSALLSIVITTALCPSSGADPADLEGGVFIAHHPATFQYSPGLDWCEEYDELYSISSCGEQNPRIDLDGNLGERSLWYVIAAWTESKTWCGAEFGFGTFDPAIYEFLEYGGCIPNDLSISTDGWPGPNEGTAVTATDVQWDGNFQAVYYFLGYAYYEGQIPLDIDPDPSFGGFGNCATPSETWAAADYGAMGLFTDGASACPGPELDGGDGEHADWSDEVACCFDEICRVVLASECVELDGLPDLSSPTCDPDPCGMFDTRGRAVITVCPPGPPEYDYAVIQEAIAAAESGDIIELCDSRFVGALNRNLDFQGKELILRSQSNNPQQCVIDCEGSMLTGDRIGITFDTTNYPGITYGQSLVRGVQIANGWNRGEEQ